MEHGNGIFKSAYQPAAKKSSEDCADYNPCAVLRSNGISLFFPKVNIVPEPDEERRNFSECVQQDRYVPKVNCYRKLQFEFFLEGRRKDLKPHVVILATVM